MLSAVGVIPARYGSSRLPGKPLADLQGKPLLYHVYHRACRANLLREVWIATDDDRVFTVAEGFGARVVMTSRGHRSGTDRIAEAIQGVEADIIVNIQADEPLINFGAIDHVVNLLARDQDAEMATLKIAIDDPADLWNPNVVKVVADQRGYAVYFSRMPIPYLRKKEQPAASLLEIINEEPSLLRYFYRHLGLYAYRRELLLKFTTWAPSPLEMLEDLEQLRAIEHGTKIKIDVSSAAIFGVDTPEDLERIRRLVQKDPKLLEA
jgi:3-deoxy-manno-octulosonate cytidylyltransferase (CMP-KDO synthetase)